MALVYQGQKGMLRKAFKLLQPDKVANNPRLSNLFLNEIEVQAQLNHPNIVNLHDAYPYQLNDGNNVTVLEMEWLEGSNLQDYVVENYSQGLSPNFVRRIALQVCSGMIHAHSKGILHLDLKPSNLFLTSENNIKIIDFGIAKIVGDNADIIEGAQNVTVISEVGKTSFKGTPAFSAPEQQYGVNLSFASDIYAFGQTLHFLLTGTTNPAVEVRNQKFKDIIEKCTQLNPNNRYGSFDELRQAIKGPTKRQNSDIPVNSQPKLSTIISDPAPERRVRENNKKEKKDATKKNLLSSRIPVSSEQRYRRRNHRCC